MSPTNSGAVANMVSASPTELALMDAKNVTQWAATIQPTPPARRHAFHDHRSQRRVTSRNNPVLRPPMVTRQNTKGSASMEISFPKIPVNPKMTTMPWSSSRLRVRGVIAAR